MENCFHTGMIYLLLSGGRLELLKCNNSRAAAENV